MVSKELAKAKSEYSSTIYYARLSPCGKFLATCLADKSVMILEVPSFKRVMTLKGHSSHVTSVAWIPGDSTKLMSCSWDETMKYWDLSKGQVIYTFTGHNCKINCMSVAPDGDCILTGGEDKLVKLWRLSGHNCFLTLSGHTEEVMDVAVSPDGTVIASCSLDKTIRTYNSTMM
eukprot:gene21438-28404_t